MAVRPIHATTHRHHATPRSRLDATVYHTRVTCHSAIQDTIVRDRPTLDDMRTTAPLPVPPQPFSLMPRRRTTRMSGGPCPRRLRHIATQRTTPHERRRRQSCRRPPPPHCACHTELVAARRQLTLAHPPLRMPSAACSHTATCTATPPCRHAATLRPRAGEASVREHVSWEAGQARRERLTLHRRARRVEGTCATSEQRARSALSAHHWQPNVRRRGGDMGCGDGQQPVAVGVGPFRRQQPHEWW